MTPLLHAVMTPCLSVNEMKGCLPDQKAAPSLKIDGFFSQPLRLYINWHFLSVAGVYTECDNDLFLLQREGN